MIMTTLVMVGTVALAVAPGTQDGGQLLDWTGTGEFAGMAARLWVPAPDRVTRGVIVLLCHGRPPGADRRWALDAPWDETEGEKGEVGALKRLAARYDFGVLGLSRVSGFDHWREPDYFDKSTLGPSTRALWECLEEMATQGRPELRHAPLLALGGSGGGVAAWSLACAVPERVLAVASLEPMVCLPGLLPLAAAEVPIVMFQGTLANGRPGRDRSERALREAELHGVRDRCERAMRESRLHGARTAYVNITEMGHEDGPTFDVTLPFLEWAIVRRLPVDANPREGAVTLRSVPREEGWLVDPEAADGADPIRAAAGSTHPERAYWLPERSLAHTFRGLMTVTPGPVLRATPVDAPERRLGTTRPHVLLEEKMPYAPEAKAFDVAGRAGQRLTLTVEERRGVARPVTGWRQVEFFRDGGSIAVVTAGEPSVTVEVAAGERFFQTFTAHVTDAGGVVRPTRYGVTLAVDAAER